MQLPSGSFAHANDVLNTLPDILPNRLPLLFTMNQLLKPAWNCTNTSFNILRQKLRQQIKKQIRVGHTPRRSPIRQIDLFLHSRAVELSVGKSVDGENVAI